MLDEATFNSPVILNWSETSKWTSTSGLLRYGELPDGWELRQIGDFLELVSSAESVDPAKLYDLAGVKWYGEGVFHRETVVGREQSASKLHRLVSGTLVYNRLFAWKASFAVVQPAEGNLYVSNEFPQFKVRQGQDVLIEYIYLTIITSKLQRAVNAASIGSAAVSRNRFKESDFLDFRIPVPPLDQQELIVANWSSAKSELNDRSQKAFDLSIELDSSMKARTRDFNHVVGSNNFVASSSKTSQWDIKAGRAAAFIESNPSFVRLAEYTEECSETVRPWDDPDKEWPVYGVNNKDGVFLNSHQKGKDFNAPYKRIKKDWFFHNPTRANVGSLGKVSTVPEDAITSPEYQVWRLTGGFLPEFMALLIRTDYFLSLVDFNRVGGVKQRMYYSNLAEIRLPMVPMREQQAIADRYAALLEDIENARAELESKKQDIEQMILGTMKIEGN